MLKPWHSLLNREVLCLACKKVTTVLIDVVFVSLEKVIDYVVDLWNVCCNNFIWRSLIYHMLSGSMQMTFINFFKFLKISLLIFNFWIFIDFIVLCVSAEQTLPMIRINTFTVWTNAFRGSKTYHVKHSALEPMKVSPTSKTRNTSSSFQASKALVLGIFFQMLQHRLDIYPFFFLHFVIRIRIGFETFFVKVIRLATTFLLKWTS